MASGHGITMEFECVYFCIEILFNNFASVYLVSCILAWDNMVSSKIIAFLLYLMAGSFAGSPRNIKCGTS